MSILNTQKENNDLKYFEVIVFSLHFEDSRDILRTINVVFILHLFEKGS